MKSTPGPWKFGKTIRCECGGSPTCWHTFDEQVDIFPPIGHSGPVAIVSSEEDARLIASAPELLEALKAVRDDEGLADVIQGVGAGLPPFMHLVLNAIRKAEGK